MIQEEGKFTSNKKNTPKLLRGFKDILPDNEKYWKFVNNTVAGVAREYGFSHIATPILEEARVFERTVGESSDVVSKEMFCFNLPRRGDDEDAGQSVVLRPEGTAPVVRAYLEHGMHSLPQPVKLWYHGPMFRYERPQAGRYRQHHQFGFEILGDAHPIIDAQLIIVLYSIYSKLGLEVIFPINSIGCGECRPLFIEKLKEFLLNKLRRLCSDCRKRLKTNPLRVLDCKEESCCEVFEEAPQILDFLCNDCREHFIAVLEYLDELDIPYALNQCLVRGFDYYTRTTFEAFLKEEYEEKGTRAQALSGGGRYDKLAEILGGRATPGIGFGQGIERVILALKECKISIPEVIGYDIFIAQLGKDAKQKALVLFDDLRKHGWRIAESLSKDGLSQQLERAHKLGVSLTLIIGQKEIIDGTIIIRDMSSGIQEEVNFEKLPLELKKRITSTKISSITKNSANDMNLQKTQSQRADLFNNINQGEEVAES